MPSLFNELDAAVRILVGAGPVKQRLIEAYRGHLSSLHENEVPDLLRSRHNTVRLAMHASPAAGGLSAPEVSVRKMSEKDADTQAVQILEMFALLCTTAGAELGGAPRLRIVGAPTGADDYHDDDETPAFLSRA